MTTRHEAESLRDAAAAAVVERIRERATGTPKTVRPLLEFIAAHLFDRGLSYERMRRELRIRDNNRSTVFRQEVGLTPAAYVRDCRFEVACRLLRESDLDTARIGDLIGYSGPNVFAAAFRRWAGTTPSRYRRQEQRRTAAAAANGWLAATGEEPDLSPAGWRRFVEGELTAGEASLVLRFALDRYPAARRTLVRELLHAIQIGGQVEAAADSAPPRVLVPSLRSLLAREDIERLMAELMWEEVRDRPWAEVVDLVRHHVWSSSALVEFLGERSRIEGREDRGWGVQVAELAIEAAEAAEGVGTDAGGRGVLKAIAWAWLGNAKRLALDLEGAEAAFAAAEQRLPEGAPATAGTVGSMRAALRIWQRRYAEAGELATRAIGCLEAAGDMTSLARTHLLRAAAEFQSGGSLERAAEDARVAIRLVEHRGGDEELHVKARVVQAVCLVHLGTPDAEAAITALREVAQPETPIVARVVWLEGLRATREGRWDEACLALTQAATMLDAKTAPLDLAVVTLDLAFAYCGAGNAGEARRLAEEALPLFAALRLGEALVAEAVRQEAGEVEALLVTLLDGRLTAEELGELRGRAGRIGTF